MTENINSAVTAINPNSLEEYTATIKQWLAQRREISQRLSELDEQFKVLKVKTTNLHEADKALDAELADLQDQVANIKEKFPAEAIGKNLNIKR